MKRLFAVLLLVVLAGCGSDTYEPVVIPNVAVHYVAQSEIQALVEASRGSQTKTHYEYTKYLVDNATGKTVGLCDIYQISLEAAQSAVYFYPNNDGTFTELRSQLLYEWLKGHGLTHCELGDYHN